MCLDAGRFCVFDAQVVVNGPLRGDGACSAVGCAHSVEDYGGHRGQCGDQRAPSCGVGLDYGLEFGILCWWSATGDGCYGCVLRRGQDMSVARIWEPTAPVAPKISVVVMWIWQWV